jgi:PUA domain protein
MACASHDLMKTGFLSKRDTASFVEKLESSWPRNIIPKTKVVKEYQINREESLFKSDVFTAVRMGQDGVVLPFVGDTTLLAHFPSVTVDMGAVRFVCNGAKVTRPGIIGFDDFKKGNIVVVRDEVHRKPLAVGVALIDSHTAKEDQKGYVIETMHYISDKMWEAYKLINL